MVDFIDECAGASAPQPNADLRLDALFSENRHRRWIFVKPGGNWGDQLIYRGAEKLARFCRVARLDADFRTFPSMEVPPESWIYLHGGGGFNSWGSGRAFDMLRRAVDSPAAGVVQGPQTCELGNPAVAARFAELRESTRCSNVFAFAREPTSFAYMRQQLPKSVTLALGHDTALNLDAEDIMHMAGLARRPRGRYQLWIGRNDDEMPGEAPSFGAAGISLDPATYASSFEHWIRIHLYARSIVSNRLHSAILGTIAGIPVTLLPGSYHKNRSIWEFSLRERGVAWADSAPAGAGRGFDLLSLCPPFLRRSWKVQRLALLLKGMPSS